MVGLSGYVGLWGAASAHDRGETLRRMTRKLAHRGPDAEGYFEQGPAHLGHRRLSVIDIEASRQPMATADGRFNLVYNGEVYNFKALRAELQAAGRNFRTAGDTEGGLQSMRHWGEKSLDKLQGMFALAAWDAVEQSLFVARDHLGVKPLYYFWDGRLFAFGSELKALLEHPGLPHVIDLDALGQFLDCQYIPTPLTR